MEVVNYTELRTHLKDTLDKVAEKKATYIV